MFDFLLDYWPIAILVGLFAALGMGAAAYAFLDRRTRQQRRRAPREWPVTMRAISNSEERKIWRWLELAFVDYSVMVKMPVTRFLTPDSQKQGQYWFELLSSLYCTFTVVRADGRIIGCVDLSSDLNSKSRSQRMKARLFAQCGVAYLVLQKGTHPSIAQIRLEFLGADSEMPQTRRQTVALDAASSVLRDAISRKRYERQHSASSATPSDTMPSGFHTHSDSGWLPSSSYTVQLQDDSFLMPIDSRSATLKK